MGLSPGSRTVCLVTPLLSRSSAAGASAPPDEMPGSGQQAQANVLRQGEGRATATPGLVSGPFQQTDTAVAVLLSPPISVTASPSIKVPSKQEIPLTLIGDQQ